MQSARRLRARARASLGHTGVRAYRGVGEQIAARMGLGSCLADLLGCRKDEGPAATEAGHLVGDTGERAGAEHLPGG
jgi:hypothetical protein